MVAETQAQADRLFVAREVWRAERERGRYVPLPSPEEAAAFEFTDSERARNASLRGRALSGTPELVKERLSKVADQLGVDEVAVVTAAHDPEDRRTSYRLLAEAFELNKTKENVPAPPSRVSVHAD
jgi:alkanesulfonate monooxygenase SsuD/methylene tetrahydromethanopterin reductase-like flavin-dependent oxidoreductase (luciferase family)